MSKINKKVEIEDTWMYTKNWAKVQKLDPQPSHPEVWNTDIQCFFQLIKEVNIIGGQSKTIICWSSGIEKHLKTVFSVSPGTVSVLFYSPGCSTEGKQIQYQLEEYLQKNL